MKNLIIVFILVLFISCEGNSEKRTDEQKQVEPNMQKVSQLMPAPDFKLQDINGESVSLKDFSGKTVLLVFWATWCPHCKKEIPKLKEIYENYKDKDFDIIAISVDDNLEKLKKFVEKNEIKYKVLFDKETDIARLYGVMGIPAHYVVDKDGNGQFFGPGIGSAMSKVDLLLQNN
ncbi:MAG TPA: TlpA family protein disulfide reductase [bacterium]|nr:TlpA family protein disulfide reductase [bacterium]